MGTSFSIAALGLFIGKPVAGAILSGCFGGLQVWTGGFAVDGSSADVGISDNENRSKISNLSFISDHDENKSVRMKLK